MPPELTLYLDGPRVTSDYFMRAATAFFDLLDEVTSTYADKGRPIEWVVSARTGSVGLGAKPCALQARAPVVSVAKSAYSGLRLIGRSARRPAHYNDPALESLRILANVADGTHVESVRVDMGELKTDISPRMVEHIDEVFGGLVRDHGTLEGTLETVSARRRPRFVLYDVLTDEPVRCYVRPEQLPNVLAAFNKRIAVTGAIRYRKDGTPVSIDADGIYVFPPDDELPAPEDVYGILAEHPPMQ